MRLQDVWAGEAAGLQQCSADSLPIHRRPLQCRATRRLSVGRRVRAAPPCCPPIANHYGAERPNRSVLRDACEQHDRTSVEPTVYRSGSLTTYLIYGSMWSVILGTTPWPREEICRAQHRYI
jgi:hypothetical protein